jgi:hypothetical protein
MNNEPVAYINVEERKLEWAKPMTWHTPTIAQMDKIPLYTHPARESKAKDRFSNYESICLQCGTTIYKPAFKTLTDEQINWFAKAYTDRKGKLNTIDFARAILRKAQEK